MASLIVNASTLLNVGCIGSCEGTRSPPGKSAWLLISSFLMASMLMGYALLSAGNIRDAVRSTTLSQYIMAAVISCLVFTSVTNIFDANWIVDADGNTRYELMVTSWTFSAICVVIGCGSLAERANFVTYLGHSILVTGLIFIPLADAVWRDGSGFLHRQMHRAFDGNHHFHDCAGSGVVHLVGSIAALAGNSLIGRRIVLPSLIDACAEHVEDPLELISKVESGCDLTSSFANQKEQFFPKTWKRRFDDAARDNSEFRSCTYMQTMGLFVLWVGWFALTSSATLTTGGNAYTAALVAWNTAVSGSCGGVGAYIYLYSCRVYVDVGFICNGISSGLVAGAALCDIASPIASGLVGLIAGAVVFPFSSLFLKRLSLDDPSDGISVHGACGLLGVLATGLCKPPCDSIHAANLLSPFQVEFCSDNHRLSSQMLAQLWGIFIILSYTCCISFPFWLVCVISERVRFMEVLQAEEALKMLMAFSRSPEQDAISSLQTIARLSPTTRKIMRQHGWTGFGFVAGRPENVMKLIEKLHNAKSNDLQSSLEEDTCWLLKLVVQKAHACWPIRELAFLRIRMHPKRELAGLSAVDAEQKSVISVMQLAAQQLAHLRCMDLPLEAHVQELTRRARTQEALLQALADKRQSKYQRHMQKHKQKQLFASGVLQSLDAKGSLSGRTSSTTISGSEDLSLAVQNLLLNPNGIDRGSDGDSLCSDDSFSSFSDEVISVSSEEHGCDPVPRDMSTSVAIACNTSPDQIDIATPSSRPSLSQLQNSNADSRSASYGGMVELQQHLFAMLLSSRQEPRSSSSPTRQTSGPSQTAELEVTSDSTFNKSRISEQSEEPQVESQLVDDLRLAAFADKRVDTVDSVEP